MYKEARTASIALTPMNCQKTLFSGNRKKKKKKKK